MHYILVHGSWHGSWCWEKLAELLKAKGHTVDCIDLPSFAEVSYQDYYTHLEKAVLACDESPVLVAHSMSGMLAAPLADRMGDKVKHLFFIAAIIPSAGESLLDVIMRYHSSEIPSILKIDFEKGMHILDLEGAKEVLYHECSQEIKEWAASKLSPQPYKPLQYPVEWIDSLKARDKRTYIICEKDRDVDPQLQKDTSEKYPCRKVKISCGHFPFLSHLEELMEIITTLHFD